MYASFVFYWWSNGRGYIKETVFVHFESMSHFSQRQCLIAVLDQNLLNILQSTALQTFDVVPSCANGQDNMSMEEMKQEMETLQKKNNDLQSAMQKIFEALNCPICLTPATNMKITNCGHLFCQECIVRVQSPFCPSCRDPLQPLGPLQTRAKTVYALQDVMDIVKTQQALTESSPLVDLKEIAILYLTENFRDNRVRSFLKSIDNAKNVIDLILEETDFSDSETMSQKKDKIITIAKQNFEKYQLCRYGEAMVPVMPQAHDRVLLFLEPQSVVRPQAYEVRAIREDKVSLYLTPVEPNLFWDRHEFDFPIDIDSFGLDYIFILRGEYKNHFGMIYSRKLSLDPIASYCTEPENRRYKYEVEIPQLNSKRVFLGRGFFRLLNYPNHPWGADTE